MADRRDKYEVQHLADMAKYDKKIWAIFKKVCHEAGLSVGALESIVKAAGKDAVFARIPAVRKVLDKLQRKLADSLKTTVVDGIKAEWSLANKKYDALVGTLGGGDLWEQLNEANRIKMMAQNLAVRDAFIARKEGGLDLSQRVWNYSGQMRDAVELALEDGIWEGRSAAEIARELQQYLKNPDKLFRRVRDKETGELKLSKPASLYHPGQGVYRSSYQNAVRLARTETNIAYRKSDTVRREGLYFVVGIEIHLSNNHNCKGVKEGEFHDICDELAGKYPADFDFSGWHPNCRCWTSSILQTDEEFIRDSDGVYRGSVNEVKDVPPQFKEWVRENKDRIDHADGNGKLAYFLRDNRWAWDEDAARPHEKKANTALAKAEERHAKRTEKKAKEIRERWEMRRRAYKNADNVRRLMDSVPGMRDYLEMNCPSAYRKLVGETPVNGNYDSLNMSAYIAGRVMQSLKQQYYFLADPWEAFKKYGVEKTMEAGNKIQVKLNSFKNLSLQDQLKKLRFEADWTEKNKKYSTWELARDAYLKEAGKVEWRIEWQEISDKLAKLAQDPYADADMVKDVRSYIGHDKDEAEYALAHLEIDIERMKLDDEYNKFLAEAPGAVNYYAREMVENAMDSFDLAETKQARIALRGIINTYRTYKAEIEAMLPNIKDGGVETKIRNALASNQLGLMGDAIDLGQRYEKFRGLVAAADTMLEIDRDELEKLSPATLKLLEKWMVPSEYSEEEIDRLRTAIFAAKKTIDDWSNVITKFVSDYEGYATNSKDYKALVKEANGAIADYDKTKLDEIVEKLKEKKAKLESEKAYVEGINAEWAKMKSDVQTVVDALNDSDAMIADDDRIALAIVEFQDNEAGPRKIRDARKAYKEILDLADKLGIHLDPVFTDDGVTFGPGAKVKRFADSDFTQARKDKALWYKTKAACYKKFSPIAEKFFDAASDEEKKAQRDYTRGSGFMNRPLRGYEDSWHDFKGIGKVPLNHESSTGAAEIKAFTEFLDRCYYDFDVWVQRGIESTDGLKGFLGLDSLDDDKVNAMVGKTVVDTAFVSCGSSKGTGFSGHILNIYCPKGTKMLYVENHSAFGGGSENETIIQRNTHFRILKVERVGYKWYIDVEVVAQI